MPDQTTRGTVLVAKDGRLCVVRDSYDDGLVFIQPTSKRGFQPLVDYNGVNRGSLFQEAVCDSSDLALLEGNGEIVGQEFWEWSDDVGQAERRARRGLIMDLLAMTFEQTDGDLKPSPKFQFYAAELTGLNGRATKAGDQDCPYPYRPPQHRLLDVGDKVFLLAAKWYKSIKRVYSGVPMRPTRAAIDGMKRERQRLEALEYMKSDRNANPLRKTGFPMPLPSLGSNLDVWYQVAMRHPEPGSETDTESDEASLSEQSDSPSSPQESGLTTFSDPSGARDLIPLSEKSSSTPPKSTTNQPSISKKRKRAMMVTLAALPNTSKTTSATNAAVPSAKQQLPSPSNEEDQDDEEALPAFKLKEEVPGEAQPEAQPEAQLKEEVPDDAQPEAQPEAQSCPPAQQESAGVAKIAITPVGDASSVVRSAEENEDMDAEDIDLEMRNVELEQRNVELEQRKIRLHQMRRALEKKKQLHKEG